MWDLKQVEFSGRIEGKNRKISLKQTMKIQKFAQINSRRV
jgi:hypothetical protein